MLSDDSDDDKSCWIGSNVVGGMMSGVVFLSSIVLLLFIESVVGTDAAVAAEGV